MMIERDYYPLADAARKVGCTEADLIHLAATGKIRAGVLVSISEFDEVKGCSLDAWKKCPNPSDFRTIDYAGFAYLGDRYIADAEATGLLSFNAVEIPGRAAVLFSFNPRHIYENLPLSTLHFMRRDLEALTQETIDADDQTVSEPTPDDIFGWGIGTTDDIDGYSWLDHVEKCANFDAIDPIKGLMMILKLEPSNDIHIVGDSLIRKCNLIDRFFPILESSILAGTISTPCTWEALIRWARGKGALEYCDPDTISIIENKHKLLFGLTEDEAAHPPGRRKQQFEAILAVIAALEYDPLKIPNGGKAKVKTACLTRNAMFTDYGFDHAWKAALADDLVRMEKHDIYAKRE